MKFKIFTTLSQAIIKLMKKHSTSYFIILFLIIVFVGIIQYSCTSNPKNEEIITVKKEFNITDHINIDERPILIYVIDRWTCFRCGPLYCNSVKILEQVDTSIINKVLIFQYMREIERKKFLRDNLYINIDSNDFQIIFNNSVFSNIHKKYGKRQSLVLGFNDIENNPVFINHFQKRVYEEIVEFINSVDPNSHAEVDDYMWY
jgi:hypothetical protein